MAYTPPNPNGAATAANSSPVAIATDQVNDVLITGQGGQSAAGRNILLDVAGTGPIDVMAYTPTLRSFSTQIIGSAGITAGAVTFEESNDGTTWLTVPVYNDTGAAAPLQAALTVAASSNNFWSGRITRRYVRARISTAFTGGTVQAITKFSSYDMTPRVQTVAQTSSGNLNTTAYISPNSANAFSSVTTASTNATSAKASSTLLMEITVSNPTATAVYVKLYSKASAPTVGTDVPLVTIPVAAGATVAMQFGTQGKRFLAGLAYAATAAAAATDTGVAVAGVQISGSYL